MDFLKWLSDLLNNNPSPSNNPPANNPPPPKPSPPQPPTSPQPPVVAQAVSKPTPSPPTPPPPKEKKKLFSKLELGKFTPITDAELRKKARGTRLWASPFFGRRDIIPPSSDDRTSLIDRALVTHGFLTPEELAEIHQVGDEMDRIRPHLSLANQMAHQAVERSKEEKERIKQQKKAEAAQRRKQKAEAVAERRATDIIYLGRGVSSKLHDRRSNVEKLQQAGLPILSTPAGVSQALGLTIPQLRWLAFHSDAATRIHYIRFSIPKKSGGQRELAAPHTKLALAQFWILHNILNKIPLHPAAHGFAAGRSTVSNALPHVKQSVVVNTDLKDFFPTISFYRVRGLFQQLGYSPAVSTIFALLCTESPRREVSYAGKILYVAAGPRVLPQGACTSPAISNLVSRKMDARLAGMAEKRGWNYTRYADDLSFSTTTDADHVGWLLARVRHMVQEEGFAVNEAKTRVLRPSTSQRVTGVVVNQRPGISRQTIRCLRSILHHAKTEGLAAQNRDNLPNFDAWLQGMLAYISMVNPQQAAPLQAAYAELK